MNPLVRPFHVAESDSELVFYGFSGLNCGGKSKQKVSEGVRNCSFFVCRRRRRRRASCFALFSPIYGGTFKPKVEEFARTKRKRSSERPVRMQSECKKATKKSPRTRKETSRSLSLVDVFVFFECGLDTFFFFFSVSSFFISFLVFLSPFTPPACPPTPSTRTPCSLPVPSTSLPRKSPRLGRPRPRPWP